jgi:hypothetical protein
MTDIYSQATHTKTFPLQRRGKGCSHSNKRQIREVGTLGNGDLSTLRPKPTSGKDRREEIYTGESYRVVVAQSENKREERKLGTDLLIEFVQAASKCGSVEDFVCYCFNNLFKCYKYF